MSKQEQNIINFIVKAFFIASLILFVLSISNDKENNRFESQHHILVSNSSSSNANAILADAIKLPIYQKSWTANQDKFRFCLMNLFSKNQIDNNKTVQIIISLQKFEQVIKPMNICMFYHYLFPSCADEQPVLS